MNGSICAPTVFDSGGETGLQAMEQEEMRQKMKDLFDSAPEWVQAIVLRFLKLSMADADFWAYYQSVTAERGFMPPKELDSFMGRWLEERPGKKREAV